MEELQCRFDEGCAEIEQLRGRLKRQRTEANRQGKLRMSAMTEIQQLKNYAARLNADLEALRSHGSGAVEELVAKNKAQVMAMDQIELLHCEQMVVENERVCHGHSGS